MSSSYVIDKVYDFYDNDKSSTSVRIQLEHDEVVKLAEAFINDEEYYEVDNFIKDYIDEEYAQCLAHNLYEQWKEEAEVADAEVDEAEDRHTSSYYS